VIAIAVRGLEFSMPGFGIVEFPIADPVGIGVV